MLPPTESTGLLVPPQKSAEGARRDGAAAKDSHKRTQRTQRPHAPSLCSLRSLRQNRGRGDATTEHSEHTEGIRREEDIKNSRQDERDEQDSFGRSWGNILRILSILSILSESSARQCWFNVERRVANSAFRVPSSPRILDPASLGGMHCGSPPAVERSRTGQACCAAAGGVSCGHETGRDHPGHSWTGERAGGAGGAVRSAVRRFLPLLSRRRTRATSSVGRASTRRSKSARRSIANSCMSTCASCGDVRVSAPWPSTRPAHERTIGCHSSGPPRGCPGHPLRRTEPGHSVGGRASGLAWRVTGAAGQPETEW